MNGINSVLEESIRLHAHNFGLEKAHDLAYSAGVSVTEQGKVTLLVGDPFVVLLRLARLYTLEGKMAGQPEYAELVSLSWPLRALGGSQSDQHQFEPRVKS